MYLKTYTIPHLVYSVLLIRQEDVEFGPKAGKPVVAHDSTLGALRWQMRSKPTRSTCTTFASNLEFSRV